MRQRGEKTDPVGADTSLKIRKTATRGISLFLMATSQPKGFAQFSDATSDLLSVFEVDAYLEGFTAIGSFGVPLSQASVGERQATQQFSFFRRINSVLSCEGGGAKTPLRFFECSSLKSRPSGMGQPKYQSVAIGERSGLQEMIGDFSG